MGFPILLLADDASNAQWAAQIADIAHGRVVWNSIADCSPWDGFYSDYRGATAALRQRIDQAFAYCWESEDPYVLEAVISHAETMPVSTAGALLLRLLDERSAFLFATMRPDSERPLLGLLLAVLASRAAIDDVGLRTPAREAVLAWVPRVGPLLRSVGSFFGTLGPAAVDALVAVLPSGAENESMLAATGYELHRDPVVWAAALATSQQWPPGMRAALQRGGAEHATRFPD